MIPTTIVGLKGKTIKVPSQFIGELKSKTNSNLADENITVRSYGRAMTEATDHSVKACYLVGGGIPAAEGIFHVLSENTQYFSDKSFYIYAEDVHQIYVNAGCHSITLPYIRAMMSQAFQVYKNGGISNRREMKSSVGRLFASEFMSREKIRINGQHLSYGYRFITFKK